MHPITRQTICSVEYFIATACNINIFACSSTINSKTCKMSRRRHLRKKISFLTHSAQVMQCTYDFLENDSEDDNDNFAPNRKERSCWESDWLKKRPTEGVCAKLLPQLDSAGTEIERKLFTSFTRLSRTDFDCLHELVAPLIHKADTNMRAAIPTRTRLALTLHFLSTGNSYRSMQYLFIIPACTISKIIPETLDAIYEVLAPKYLKVHSFIISRLSRFIVIFNI